MFQIKITVNDIFSIPHALTVRKTNSRCRNSTGALSVNSMNGNNEQKHKNDDISAMHKNDDISAKRKNNECKRKDNEHKHKDNKYKHKDNEHINTKTMNINEKTMNVSISRKKIILKNW